MKREPIDRLMQEIDWTRGPAVRLTRNHADAEDLVQDTWISVLRSPAGQVDRARPWLQRVMRALAADLPRHDGSGGRPARPRAAGCRRAAGVTPGDGRTGRRRRLRRGAPRPKVPER